MTTQLHFDTALFAFLAALRSNNNREWFHAHKQRYERDVRDPMLRFIGDVGPHLWQISPRFVADARPNGRSLFRVQRDVRFTPDKRPYKTNAGAHFRHEAGRDVHAPGFYLHLELGRVFVASGVWHLTGCEFSAAQELLVVATEEGHSSIREWCGQKNAEDSGAQSGTKCR
jgi:uncharacterized protein (TIGR02453 family)